MKKAILIVATLFISAGIFAQAAATTKSSTSSTNSTVTSTTTTATPAAKYCCAKCDYCADKAGQCPKHKVALVQQGMYYCATCDGQTSAKPGKCPKCGKDMKKMEPKKG